MYLCITVYNNPLIFCQHVWHIKRTQIIELLSNSCDETINFKVTFVDRLLALNSLFKSMGIGVHV